jgi:hypothetical protein
MKRPFHLTFMTYHTNNKILRPAAFRRQENQAGITLMLAVLVLAGITAIAFSIAAIVFVEIRASGDLLRTEPALYAVQSVTEEAFYGTTRNIEDFPFSTEINGVNLAIAERAYDPSPQTYVIYYNTETKFSLADPAAPFQNSYTTVRLEYINPPISSTLTAQLYQYQDNGQTGVASEQELNYKTPDWTINLEDYANNEHSEFEIVLTTDNPNNSTILITSSRNGDPSGGLPLIGRKAYDVAASYLGLTRRYTVSTPTQNSTGGGGAQDGGGDGGATDGGGDAGLLDGGF